jgi:hypothetical protein
MIDACVVPCPAPCYGSCVLFSRIRPFARRPSFDAACEMDATSRRNNVRRDETRETPLRASPDASE